MCIRDRYYSVLFGGQALLLDPKSERGNWKQTLPEIAHEINIVNPVSYTHLDVYKRQDQCGALYFGPKEQ